MNLDNQQQVITYVPKESQETEEPASDMGTTRPGLWMYIQKLGLKFSLFLLLALAFQVFVAVFIALNGLKIIPIFANISPTDSTRQILSNVAAIMIAVVIQGLLIYEVAQVVWLRQPNRLKVRPMSGSVWWWVMLVALVLTLALDFLLLFLSVTNKTNLQEAWQTVLKNQTTGFTILLLSLLNFLTLLGCAAVMRTRPAEETRPDVEDSLDAFADEILAGAGNSARARAAQVWKKLAVNPQRFIPIHASVLNLISKKHPNWVPPYIGGANWAYDFTGNTFAAVPPDVHQALLQNRHRLNQGGQGHFDTDDNQLLWRLPPADMAEMIAYNMGTYGKPRFVDITDPANPKFLTRPLELGAMGFSQVAEPSPEPVAVQAVATQKAAQPRVTLQPATTGQQVAVASPGQSFVASLTPAEKALFGSYLTHTVFPHVHNSRFPQGVPDLSIFEAFDSVELQLYYSYWKKQTGSRN